MDAFDLAQIISAGLDSQFRLHEEDSGSTKSNPVIRVYAQDGITLEYRIYVSTNDNGEATADVEWIEPQ